MGVIYSGNNIKFDGIITEHEAKNIKDYLLSSIPSPIVFDFVDCGDIHTAIIQIICAYRLKYDASFIFGGSILAYQMALEGVFICEDNIN